MKNTLIQDILTRLKQVVPQKASLHEPFFGGNEKAYVTECVETGWVSSVGKFVDAFERSLEAFTGAKRAVAVGNGTASLHVCLMLAGVKPGDEVLIPTLTFVATANAVIYCNATPHFVDAEERSLGIDVARLADYLADVAMLKADGCYNKATGRRIAAVVPVHVFGHPIDLDPLLAVCERYKIELVEDAAESLGSYYKGRHTGTFGKLSSLSFNGNKIVTTGGGGAVLTNDENLGQLAKHITTTAKVPHKWRYCHDMTGYNYRLPNINAALGVAQMEQLLRFLEAKRSLAKRYETAFAGCEGVRFFAEQGFARSNYWLNTLILDAPLAAERDAVLDATNATGLMTRPVWDLMHTLPMYAACPSMPLETSVSLAGRVINIPSSACLGG